jgi:serine/threonine-protein kinase
MSGDRAEEMAGSGGPPAPDKPELEFSVTSSEAPEEDELTPIISIDAIPGRASEEKPPFRVLGNYEIMQSIGSGGKAEVFLARHAGPMGFEKILVLKCIHPHLAKEKNFVDMFLDEARLAARINDPRVVQIHELGEANGTYFMAMEYLAGESLGTIVKTAIRAGMVIAPALAARIVADAAAGQHAAPELRDTKGRLLDVVHRDVSHGNIIVLYSGGVKVLDFGVAKARDSLQTTTAGERKGKFGYMSPEQVRGDDVDLRSDVFSLGVVLWEALTNQRLFAADSELETVRRVIDGVPPVASTLNQKVPPELDAIVSRALTKDRRDRYATAAELSRALEDWLRASGSAGSTSDVADYMRTTFAERMEKRAQLVRVGAADGAEPPLADIESRSSDVHTELVQLRASRRRLRLLLAAGGATIVLALAFYIGRSRSSERVASSERAIEAIADARPSNASTDEHAVIANGLFDRAELAIEQGKIAAPPGDNALELLLDGEKRAPNTHRAKALRQAAIAALIEDAEQLWKAGKHESARSVYADILLFDPEYPLAQERVKAPKRVASQNTTATSPDEVPWLVTQIDLAIIERRLVAPPGRNALEYLQALRKIDPSNQAVRRLSGEVATALKTEAKHNPDDAKALTAAAKVATGETSAMTTNEPDKIGDPLVAGQWVASGNSKLAAGQLAEARNAFERAVTADSASHAALAGLAEVAYNESEYTRAVLAAKRAISLAPKVAAYRMLLGKSFYKLLRYEDAIKQWKKALDLDPANAAAQKNIEMAERRMGG